MMSDVPPAPNGTMKRIGRAGVIDRRRERDATCTVPAASKRSACLRKAHFSPLLAFGAPLATYAPTRDKLGDSAANYPSKPIRFIVPYSPGAGTDTTARTIAAKLAEKWGQQVVIDNRPGASGVIAVEQTALANPDGHTICLFSASQATIESTGQKLPYDIMKDLQPVTQVTSVFFVVYHPPSLPVKSIRELIAYAKANPGKLNYGTSGIGSLQHFAGELMSHMAGIRMVQVPYKGAANIVTAMLANEVQLGFNSMFSVRPQVQAGRLRWLAITAGKRSPTVASRPSPNRDCPVTKSISGTASSLRPECRRPS